MLLILLIYKNKKMDFNHSEQNKYFLKKVKKFIEERIKPIEMDYFNKIHE